MEFHNFIRGRMPTIHLPEKYPRVGIADGNERDDVPHHGIDERVVLVRSAANPTPTEGLTPKQEMLMFLIVLFGFATMMYWH